MIAVHDHGVGARCPGCGVEIDKLVGSLEAATDSLESWIEDELSGTGRYGLAMKTITEYRTVLAHFGYLKR